ncbi:hypothetical protein FF38_11792 [Lucilia cuprina]|uniref:Uncharacterized protein n=1 Tax=Lucilia cuprina TaxID=7375 RepID=A0A0L0BYA9_LUCCU|nr:hypothetical protein FF38_11792 [Lucilia cuprina]
MSSKSVHSITISSFSDLTSAHPFNDVRSFSLYFSSTFPPVVLSSKRRSPFCVLLILFTSSPRLFNSGFALSLRSISAYEVSPLDVMIITSGLGFLKVFLLFFLTVCHLLSVGRSFSSVAVALTVDSVGKFGVCFFFLGARFCLFGVVVFGVSWLSSLSRLSLLVGHT